MTSSRPDQSELTDRLSSASGVDDAVEAFLGWVADRGLELYPAQEEALLEVASGSHVIVDTPTGSGKSMVALAAHALSLAEGRRSFYTAPIKALVSEKFFELSRVFGREHVGMVTGDAAVNADAPIVCATAEIVANMALRSGTGAGIDQVVMDEFHYFSDPDRGWAWQVPLLELTGTQFILMSATLGDVTRIVDDLGERTGREVAVVRSATRPIPLHHEFRVEPLTEVLEELLETHRSPVYVVHFTQAAAVERAQALLSMKLVDREHKDRIAAEIGDFRFSPGFGRNLSRFVRNGIGVHHAGMLPKYRRLVERLAQAGLLVAICGTDTLGVGINVPIRTVLLTGLAKYDGTKVRLLSAREFHQIGGRAGRAGFDTSGTVIALAPDHVIENAKAEAKALARSEKDGKVRKIQKKKPPPGQISWGQPTFDRLVASPPEALTSSFAVSHGMILNLLDRPGDGRAALEALLSDNWETETKKEEHRSRATEIEASLRDAGVIEELDEADDRGRTVRVTIDLQEEFALDQPLAPFALAALDLLDPEEPTWALDVVSVIESVLEDPRPVIAAQRDKARGEAVARMKAEGLEYEERMAELEGVQHPRPLAELLEPMFDVYRQAHPWVAEHPLRPKSVARDLYERAMGFGDLVAFYGLARSEGTVLRYLSDVYKALIRTVPMDVKTDDLWDLIEWLGELVRQVDSSLLDEWEALQQPEGDADAGPPTAADLDARARPVTENRRAFTVLVRNAMFRRVELAARRDWEALGTLDGDDGWAAQRWADSLAPFVAEHGMAGATGADGSGIGVGDAARSPAMLLIDEEPGRWSLRQILDDPDGERAWSIRAEVDLAASDEAGDAVIRVIDVGET